MYDQGWATGPEYKNGKVYLGTTLPLSPDFGGPVFFMHYSFMGLDPHGLQDTHTDYWQQNVAHTRINHGYYVASSKAQKGYGPNCWGLTASGS